MDKKTTMNIVNWIETSPAAHYTLKKALRDFSNMDPVDAFYDIKLLYKIFETKTKG